ncbi:MAG: 50S ribosomal protein L31 [Elusimicrobiota bacterium]
MKEGIHPSYQLVQVVCACGNAFATRSTLKELKLEICSACHPFFTGKQKFVDTEGRINRFLKKFDQAKVHKEVLEQKAKAVKKAAQKKAAVKAVQTASQEKPKKAKVLSTRLVTKKG